MPELALNLQLLADVVATERAATLGGHRTRPVIPGSMLLGACAARLYEKLNSGDAYRIFHSGAVRFGDGLPGASGSSLPMPLSFHKVKGEEGPVLNLAASERISGKQYTQLREGFVCFDLKHLGQASQISVSTSYSMRTAIGEGNQARDGLLFGIESITAGQCFTATIEADEARDLDLIRRSLLASPLRLGRSRQVEFGTVRATEVSQPSPLPKTANASQGTVRVYLISDLALRDAATGEPRLEPLAQDFGLPAAWRFQPLRSFLRSRRYSPFNAHRRRPDMERQVLSAGSVIVFEGQGIPSLDPCHLAIQSGIGEYRQDGLGRVLIEPIWLTHDSFKLEKIKHSKLGEEAPIPRDALGAWLTRRIEQSQGEQAAWDWARDQARALSWLRIHSSQWGELRAMARLSREREDTLEKFLGEKLQHFLDKGATHAAWSQRKGGKSAEDALKVAIRAAPGESALRAVELLATRMLRQGRDHHDLV